MNYTVCCIELFNIINSRPFFFKKRNNVFIEFWDYLFLNDIKTIFFFFKKKKKINKKLRYLKLFKSKILKIFLKKYNINIKINFNPTNIIFFKKNVII